MNKKTTQACFLKCTKHGFAHNKKGAIEMSMQTIIVVIIGVTLLTLGIKFVSDTMGKTTGLSDSMFESGDTLMNDIFGGSDAVLSVRPDMTTIRVGDTQSVKIYVRNTGDSDADFTIEIKEIIFSGTDKTAVTSVRTWLNLKTTKKVIAGQMWEKTLALVPPKGAKIGTYTATIECTGNQCEGETTDLIVTVKGSG